MHYFSKLHFLLLYIKPLAFLCMCYITDTEIIRDVFLRIATEAQYSIEMASNSFANSSCQVIAARGMRGTFCRDVLLMSV